MTDALTQGIHHVGLAVRDLDEATAFFCGILGFKEVARNDAYPAVFVSDGAVTLTLWRVTDPGNAVAFNRKTNIGLHHLALGVADEAALATVHERVRNHPGVVVEFDPQPIRPASTTHHFICLTPGGIRIEFATPRQLKRAIGRRSAEQSGRTSFSDIGPVLALFCDAVRLRSQTAMERTK